MSKQWKQWNTGDPVLINRIVWGVAEREQIDEVLANDWFGPGKKVVEFARSLTNFTGIEYCQPVNSGSSALMLATKALMNLGQWNEGDWILHPACTFPTSIAPAIQSGLIPFFVDIDPNTYQIDLNQAESAIAEHGDKIKGAIVPHLLGNICDIEWLLAILDGRPLIEDCCDTMGGYYNGKHVGHFGDIACFSFYGSHHVTTAGVGGALLTNNGTIFEQVKSMTHWGRNDYSLMTDPYEKFAKRYWYETIGYDFQMTEIQAAFGVAQMERLPLMNQGREQRFMEVDEYFSRYEDWFILPLTSSILGPEPSWFCYPLTIKPDAPFGRREFATYLMENKIEIRPLFTGNITRHPAFEQFAYMVLDGADVADYVGENSLFLPSWGMSDGEMQYMLNRLEVFLSRFDSRETSAHTEVAA